VLLVSGHAIATGHEADIVPGIENELVNLRESTANMSIKRLSSLIEYIQAFMAEHDIPIQEVPKSRPW
jgi:NinB protein